MEGHALRASGPAENLKAGGRGSKVILIPSSQ